MAICEHCAIRISIPTAEPVSFVAIPPPSVIVSIPLFGVTSIAPIYDGEYEYTPNDDTQVVPIEGLKATQNIIINPVPNTYGHIAWNGSYLRVY